MTDLLSREAQRRLDDYFSRIGLVLVNDERRANFATYAMGLLVLAGTLYRRLARSMRGYADAQARKVHADLLDMPATIEITDAGVEVQFHRRAHLPIVMSSGLLDRRVAVPWWNNLPLRLTA